MTVATVTRSRATSDESLSRSAGLAMSKNIVTSCAIIPFRRSSCSPSDSHRRPVNAVLVPSDAPPLHVPRADGALA